MNKKQAERIVNALLAELEGRGGMDILNIIHDDTETYSEMYESLVTRTLDAFTSPEDPAKDLWHPDRER